jgi:peptidyl-prolyl cis-trans isomerase SurA
MAPVAAQIRTSYAGAEYDEKMKEARRQFLTRVIEDKLILSEAKRKQVILKDSEVDEMMADVRNKFPTREAFLRSVEGQGYTEKKLWDRFHDQIMMQKLVAYEVRSKISVSPGEVNEYYKLHSDEFAQGDRIKLQHILIRVGTRSETEAAALAQTLYDKINAGASFAEVATANSEGAEAKDGGDMGWVEKGQLMGDIDAKIFALNEGEMTTPIPTALGYHIFRAIERQRTSVKPLADVRAEVQDLIFKEKLKERLDAWLENLKKNAYISIR